MVVEGIRIDVETGNVSLGEGLTLQPAVTETQLTETPRWAPAKRLEPSPGYVSFVLPDIEDLTTRMRVHVLFGHGSLRSISLFAVDARIGDGSGWEAWSEEKELARGEIHARWLADKGIAVGSYAWGRLLSDYDTKSGQSLIEIRYREPMAEPMPHNTDRAHTTAGLDHKQLKRSLSAIRNAIDAARAQDAREDLEPNYSGGLWHCDNMLEALRTSDSSLTYETLMGRFDYYASDSLPWSPSILDVVQREQKRIRECFARSETPLKAPMQATETPATTAANAPEPSDAPHAPPEPRHGTPIGPNLPLSRAAALRLAQRAFGASLPVAEDATIERPWGWVFCAAAGVGEDRLIGLGYIGIDRFDGSVHPFDASSPPSHWADTYRRRDRTKSRGWLSGLLARFRGNG